MRLSHPVSFRAYGLTFESEIFLSGLISGKGDADVVVRFGSVERWDGRPVDAENWIQVQPPETRLALEGIGRFSIRDGAEVIVDPAPDVDPEILQQALLGPILCLVVQQRGWYPLHASAVMARDAVVAFAGASGRGKSSLAAALNARGYPLVADDVTVIDTAVAPPNVRPGITALKLWPDALAHLGKSADSLPTLDGTTEKRRLDPHEGDLGARLECIYLLDEGAEPSITPVPAEEAVLHLIDLCHYRVLLRTIAGTTSLMPHAAKIAREVPVFRFVRTEPLSELFETASMLEEHLQAAS